MPCGVCHTTFRLNDMYDLSPKYVHALHGMYDLRTCYMSYSTRHVLYLPPHYLCASIVPSTLLVLPTMELPVSTVLPTRLLWATVANYMD